MTIFSESDRLNEAIAVAAHAVGTIRCLTADMVQKANSGHPGAPMGCAPMAHALFGHVMRFNPQNPNWWNRDRFVLSNGHACALLYSMLSLCGYKDMDIEQLTKFRQLGSLTPGHPERGLTPGVELTTGPLGQGVSAAVGLALAQTHLAARFGKDLFNNFTFVICGDGCLQEGVSSEAASLAGHWGLGRLIVLYDDNRITIDGDTSLSFTEHVSARYAAYGWEVMEVMDGDHDVAAIIAAINSAKCNLGRPTLIKVRTTIGFGSDKQGTEKTHGAPLGTEDLRNVKIKFGFDPEQFFYVPERVATFYRARAERGKQTEDAWNLKFAEFAITNPGYALELQRRFKGELPSEFLTNLPKSFTGDKATRASSGEILASLMKTVPELIGGSADLMESTVSNKGNLAAYSQRNPENRILHFGVREHAMVAIGNGIHAYGGLLPFISTFCNFIGYCWGALRLSALSHHQLLFIATHDSIDLGEDGPTHQPIEMLSLLRSTPNVLDIRPCDGKETVGAYMAFAGHKHGPTILVLNRSNLPQLVNSSAENTCKGAYILDDYGGPGAKVIIAASGSEVSLALSAKAELAKIDIAARVVSFPSWFLFEAQEEYYRETVFPQGVPVLLVEAARILGAEKYAHDTIQMKTFGDSAPAKTLKKKFGFTVENVINKVKNLLDFKR